MHASAHAIGELFFSSYQPDEDCWILDVGSADVNGSLRTVAPPTAHYVGCDLSEGDGVDVVVAPGTLPFDDGCFDLVVSTSAFEHDPHFFGTFLEMARVTAVGGHIYVNAPSEGDYHRFPNDYWRFYPDAGIALAEHARKAGFALELVESWVAPQDVSGFSDMVMVFARGTARPGPRLWKLLKGAENIHDGERHEVLEERTRMQERRRSEARTRELEALRGSSGSRQAPVPGSPLPGGRNPGSSLEPAFARQLLQSLLSYRHRGRRCWKNPFDLAIYAQLMQERRPATVIEIGSFQGGSALWFADQQHLLGMERRVLSIDTHPPEFSAEGVTFLRGDGRALSDLRLPASALPLRRPLLIVEDADHSYETSHAVLTFFAPALEPGDVIVIEDGIVGSLPGPEWAPFENGPNRAIADFLRAHPGQFRICTEYCDRFGHNVTFNTNGYLEKCAGLGLRETLA